MTPISKSDEEGRQVEPLKSERVDEAGITEPAEPSSFSYWSVRPVASWYRRPELKQ
jgi:hypothetical protein